MAKRKIKNPEELYEEMFTRYVRPSTFFKWTMIYYYTNDMKKSKIKRLIQENILKGYKVKTGWIATSVRGYHDYIIFIK